MLVMQLVGAFYFFVVCTGEVCVPCIPEYQDKALKLVHYSEEC